MAGTHAVDGKNTVSGFKVIKDHKMHSIPPNGNPQPYSPNFIPLVGPFRESNKHIETVIKENNRHFEVSQKEENRHRETVQKVNTKHIENMKKESTMYRTQNAADIKKQELRNDSVRMEREMEIEKLKALAEIEKAKQPKSVAKRILEFLRTPLF